MQSFYQRGPDGMAYTPKVSGLTTGEIDVNFAEGEVSVSKTPIMNIFLQTANPDPSAVSVVHAMVP